MDLIPPPRNARFGGKNDERDKPILEIYGLGNTLEGRSLWGKLTERLTTDIKNN